MPSTPITIRMVVVLPAPLPPTKPVISPAGTSNDTWSTAVFSPNRRVSSLNSSMTTTVVTRDPPGIHRATELRGGAVRGRDPPGSLLRREDEADLVGVDDRLHAVAQVKLGQQV